MKWLKNLFKEKEMDSKKILDKYKTAYHDVHEFYPVIERKGAWYYVGQSKTAFRLKQIDEMADRLIERKKATPEKFQEEVNKVLVQNHKVAKAYSEMSKTEVGKVILNGSRSYFDKKIRNNDEIKNLLTNIQECGKTIYHSMNLKQCRELGRKISKNAKTLINLMEDK
jgi:hypothetical protein